METQKIILPNTNRNTVLIAVLAGAIYLVVQTILGAMDIAWFLSEHSRASWTNSIYTGLTVVMIVASALFARIYCAEYGLRKQTA